MTLVDDLIAKAREDCHAALGHDDREWIIRRLAEVIVGMSCGMSPGHLRLPPAAPSLPRKPPHRDVV